MIATGAALALSVGAYAQSDVSPVTANARDTRDESCEGQGEGARILASPAITWSGSAAGGRNIAGLWIQEHLSGKSGAPAGSYLWANQINIDDALDAGHASTNLDGLNVQDVVGTNARGSRNAIRGNVIVRSSPADRGTGSSFPAYVGVFPSATIAANVGGTGTSYALAAGSIWGSNPNATAEAGATNLYGVVGEEIDVTAKRGSSTAQKYGLTIVQGSDSAVAGSQDDAAAAIINQEGAIGWREGLAFGAEKSAFWPIASDGTLIAAHRGAGAPPRAANGVDLSEVDFSASAFKSKGFSVSGSGAVLASYLRAAPTTFSGLQHADPHPQPGDRAFITDARNCTFGRNVAGGGTTRCPIYYDDGWKAG